MNEAEFIAALRGIARSPAARGLLDDCAVLEIGGEALVATHDLVVEGVHFRPEADPADVAWKLVAANLSDLAAKGARPLGLLLGFTLGEGAWDRRFAEGLGEAVAAMGAPLIGGDTVAGQGARTLGITALGQATHRPVPARSGARPGDRLWLAGQIGGAFGGFRLEAEGEPGPSELLQAHHRPRPLLAEGIAIAPLAHASADVSDGLLLDASRIAAASGCALIIELDRVHFAPALLARFANGLELRLAAASWGEDYALLAALPQDGAPPKGWRAIGRFSAGEGLSITDRGQPVALPGRLGWEHRPHP